MLWEGNEWGRTKVMRTSRDNAEYCKHSGSRLTNYERCTGEIKSRTAMSKATFNMKKTVFTRKLDLNLRKNLVKCYILNKFCTVLKIGRFGK
jgi:hypothetical protein